MGKQVSKSLSQYDFTDGQIDYVESHSNFSLRDMANVLDWLESLDKSGQAKMRALSVAKQVAVFRLSDEGRHAFLSGGGPAYLEFIDELGG